MPNGSPTRFTIGHAAAAAFAAALALYVATLAPTVTLIDSGALVVASHTLGVAHPPGFPLYTILARAVSLAPLGDVARRVNFASALFAALAAGAAAVVAWELLAGARRSAKAMDATAVIACLAAGLAFATSRTLWSYATVAEVYSLGIFLVLATLGVVLRADRAADEAQRARLYALSGFLFGLALAVHHLTAMLVLPSLAILMATRAAPGALSRRALLAGLGALAGLTIYAYLPIAASREPAPPLVWGDPRTLERFWWHVSGWQYRFQIAASGMSIAQDARAIAASLTREFGAPWLPLALVLAAVGSVALARAHRRFFAALAALAIANAVLLFAYHVKEDRDAYLLPLVAAVAIAAALGVDTIARRLGGRFVALLVALALPLAAGAANDRTLDRSRDTIGRDYATNALAPIARGGVLLTGDWHLYSALLYLREVEGVRADVAVIDFNQLWRTWYVEALRRRWPGVVAPAAAELDAFREDLRVWERDPAGFDSDAARTDRMNARFQDLIVALARAHADSDAAATGARAFYMTMDLPTKYGGPANDIMKALASEFAFVPEGLVLRLTRDRTFDPAATTAAPPPMDLHALTDGAVRIAPESVIAREVVPAYLTSYTMRATYLAMNGAWDDALAALDGAEALAPGYPAAATLRAQIAKRRATAK